MRSTYRSHKPQRPTDRSSKPAARPVQQAALGDDRFQFLLAQANAFFGTAERDMVAEKAAAIVEIKALMAEHQLSLNDLQD